MSLLCIKKYYIDGGILNNYPLNDCLNKTGCYEHEVLAFRNESLHSVKMTNKYSITDYLLTLIKMYIYNVSSDHKQKNIKNVVRCITNHLDSSIWIESFKNESVRHDLFREGCQFAKLFLEYNYNDV